MKKVLAIILSITMLFSVLAINTFADATPTVTLITNEGSPIEEGVHTYLTVRFDNFDSIKGMDVLIHANEATLGTVTSSGTGFPDLVKGENYTEVNDGSLHEIRIVDLTPFSSGKITFEVTAPAKTSLITVTGKYADSGKTLFNIETEAGNLEVKTEIVKEEIKPSEGQTEITKENPVIVEQPKAEEGQEKPTKFIPYGSVYKETADGIVYAEKDENGNFEVTDNGYQVQTFDIPENGITTFGASDEIGNTEAIRFGSFSNKAFDGSKHGTMIFHGNWLALKNYYIQKGYKVHEFVEAIYNNFDSVIAKNPDADYVSYRLSGEEIRVYKFAQKKHMWTDNNGTLEYALRLKGIEPENTYTAVAYSIDSEGVSTISEEVKSVTTPAAQ